MEKVKFNKMMRNAYASYKASNYTDNLYSLYNNCSMAKFNAMDYCKGLCYDLGGWGLKLSAVIV